MKPITIRLLARLCTAFMLGVVACHLIFGNPEASSGDSNTAVDAKASRLGDENSSEQNELTPSPSCSGHTPLQPIPDPGPGTKGFDPWAGIEPVKLAMNCDGSTCKTSVAHRQIIPSPAKKPNGGDEAGPTLAFPTVMPPIPRGQLIEVNVEFPGVRQQEPGM